MPDPTPGKMAEREAVTRGTGNVFTGILLALILKSTLDAFFKDIASYGSAGNIVDAVKSHAEPDILNLFQLLVFFFTTTRFYWGTYRYNEEVPESEGTPQLVLGLVGAVLVFSSFYVAGLMVKNANLFYPALALVHLIDMFWFLVAAACLKPPSEIQKVWSWYKLFDGLTIGWLVVLIIVGYAEPTARYVCNWMSLAGLVAIGGWDSCKFWPYYTKRSGWRQSLS